MNDRREATSMESTVTLTDQLNNFHSALYARFRKFNLHLQAVSPSKTITSVHPQSIPTISYVRLLNEAQTVERLIGLSDGRALDMKHHPIIELRLNEDWLALELVLNPEAWYDQRNWLGKLRVRRYRDEFRDLITGLSPHMRVGSWQGAAPTDKYLTSAQLRLPRVFEAWVGTYCDGRDWLRIGAWFPTAEVTPDLTDVLFDHAQTLYRLHQYIAWTGRNDFYSLFRANENKEIN